MQWDEVRDVAIAIVHAFWALRGEPCPDCVPPCPDCAHRAVRRDTAICSEARS